MEKNDDNNFSDFCVFFFRQHKTFSFTNNRFSPSNNHFLFFRSYPSDCVLFIAQNKILFNFFCHGCNRVEVRAEVKLQAHTRHYFAFSINLMNIFTSILLCNYGGVSRAPFFAGHCEIKYISAAND